MKKSLIVTAIICVIFIFSCVSTPGKSTPPIELHAFDAELITTGSLVYEEGPDRECVGWWESPDDQISWTFDVAKGGEYSVTLRVACASSFAGSLVGVTIDGQKLEFTMPDTYEWESYFDEEIGNVKLEPGSYTIVVKGLELVDRFFGNLQGVTFKKVG